ncbi:prolyl aminopeptidase [Legionella antarctica]|nr:prolyl aminopeptidase [Legionella antarctica]
MKNSKTSQSFVDSASKSPPSISLVHEGYLQVSELHEIWYGEFGNPQGFPVIVLHGGPGAGCSDNDLQLFDLTFWRVILLDQRGAKRSKPFGEMKENTTPDLISDLEFLRRKLNIDKWLVFGGSWGSTLALSYGETYSDHILGFILRGVFLARASDNLHFWYGMRHTFPEAWQEFNDFLPADQQHDLIHSYHRLIMDSNPGVCMPAARAFLKYDLVCAFLNISAEQLSMLLSDDQLVLGISRTFIHYSINNFFLTENQLINNINRMNHLPLIIVHGRYDTITCAKSAYEVHKLWPGSELRIVACSGHSAMEPGIALSLIQATEKMKERISATNGFNCT